MLCYPYQTLNIETGFMLTHGMLAAIHLNDAERFHSCPLLTFYISHNLFFPPESCLLVSTFYLLLLPFYLLPDTCRLLFLPSRFLCRGQICAQAFRYRCLSFRDSVSLWPPSSDVASSPPTGRHVQSFATLAGDSLHC